MSGIASDCLCGICCVCVCCCVAVVCVCLSEAWAGGGGGCRVGFAAATASVDSMQQQSTITRAQQHAHSSVRLEARVRCIPERRGSSSRGRGSECQRGTVVRVTCERARGDGMRCGGKGANTRAEQGTTTAAVQRQRQAVGQGADPCNQKGSPQRCPVCCSFVVAARVCPVELRRLVSCSPLVARPVALELSGGDARRGEVSSSSGQRSGRSTAGRTAGVYCETGLSAQGEQPHTQGRTPADEALNSTVESQEEAEEDKSTRGAKRGRNTERGERGTR